MDIPNALFMHAQQVELEKMFGHKPGYDMTMPVLSYAEEMEDLRMCLKNKSKVSRTHMKRGEENSSFFFNQELMVSVPP